MNKKPVTAIIVGAGHRAMVYSKLALTNPELLKIVGVADPNPIRRKVKLLPRRKTNLLSIIPKTDGLSMTLWKFFFRKQAQC